MNKEELEARSLCAHCNHVDSCRDCVPNEDCQEWRYYLDNPNSRLGKLLCYIGVHDFYKYRSSKLMKCKRCGEVRKQYSKVEFDRFLIWRHSIGRL